MFRTFSVHFSFSVHTFCITWSSFAVLPVHAVHTYMHTVHAACVHFLLDVCRSLHRTRFCCIPRTPAVFTSRSFALPLHSVDFVDTLSIWLHYKVTRVTFCSSVDLHWLQFVTLSIYIHVVEFARWSYILHCMYILHIYHIQIFWTYIILHSSLHVDLHSLSVDHFLPYIFCYLLLYMLYIPFAAFLL